MGSARTNIFNRIRQALQNKQLENVQEKNGATDLFVASPFSLEEQFIEKFSRLDGKVIPCVGNAGLYQALGNLLQEKKWLKVRCSIPGLMEKVQAPLNGALGNLDGEVAITDCECMVARTGTVVLSSSQLSGRLMAVYAPIHIIIAYVTQLVPDVNDAILLLQEKYKQALPSGIFFASGPSRTADIEKTLVLGVHGPREVYLFMIK